MPTKVAEPLRADEVHVWRLPRPRESRRAPLLALLGRYLGLPAEAVRLVEGEHGRPALHPDHDTLDAGRLDFNWSHSGELALVALAYGIAPGIDVEQARRRPNALEIAQRFFTAEEASWLAGLDSPAREQTFLELWTAREAVLKALGRGLAFGLDRLAFRRAGDTLALHWLAGEHTADWQLHVLPMDAGAHAALAWRGGPRAITCYRLEDGD